jgi:hypothetical protein
VSGETLSLGGVDPAKLPPNSIFLTLRREGEPATGPVSWRWGTLDDREVYLGYCYGRAFGWMQAQSEYWRRRQVRAPLAGVRLIHGTVVGPGEPGRMGHAWVELPDDVVFDGVAQGFYTRESYYRVMAAKPLVSFSWTAAQRQRRQQGHYGPWHQVEGG